jgi:hypothetical protein
MYGFGCNLVGYHNHKFYCTVSNRSKIDLLPPLFNYSTRAGTGILEETGTEMKLGKHSETRTKPLALPNCHGRYITAASYNCHPPE